MPGLASPPPTVSSARFVAAWLAFWSILFLLGVQEHRWGGGTGLWLPAVDYGTAVVVSSVLVVCQLRRAPKLDGLLGRPARWFFRLWKWLPLEMAAFLAAMFGVPRLASALVGAAYPGSDWMTVTFYEGAKFLLFYALLGAIQFGVRSSKAWAGERLRAEEQARLAQQAQLAQLTQQLRPHFLFNALNTVSALIHTDPELADTLLTRLAALLRSATDASTRPEQPLADELALLKGYADIMAQRFADRVRVDWEIDAGLAACPVPTLGLQALLENCFCHVVERRRAPTRIVVRAKRGDGSVCIEIEDDGDAGTGPLVFGVGLGNLQRRLASLHGEAGRLSVAQRAGGGTCVRVELPCAC